MSRNIFIFHKPKPFFVCFRTVMAYGDESHFMFECKSMIDI